MSAFIDPSVTANERFKRQADTWIWKSLILAAVLHFAMFAFGPRISVADVNDNADDTEVVTVAIKVPLPPAPPPITRPPTPMISDVAPVDVEFPKTTWDGYDPARMVPPPSTSQNDELRGYGAFTPSMVAPRLLNREEVERALKRFYPQVLRDAGIGGQVRVQLWVDEQGTVTRAQVETSSEFGELDRAALSVVETMRLSPALNRDKPVRVIVVIPVTFRIQ